MLQILLLTNSQTTLSNQTCTFPSDIHIYYRNRRGRMVVGFIANYAISAYHH